MKRFWYHVVYVGNGATEICQERFPKREVRKKKRNGIGSLRYTVDSYFIAKEIILEQLFLQEKAEFIGYTLRRKKKKSWVWYCTDGTWKDIETIVNTNGVQQVFAAGETLSLPAVNLKKKQTLYLTAQWRHEGNLDKMDCGYWVFCNPLMAHALGKAENGKTYQNTRLVFERSYALGYRYFELDVALTEDEKLVCHHGWSKHHCDVCGMEYKPEFEHMTYELFMKQTVNGSPVMDINDLLQLMRQYPDTYFEIDLHRDNYEKKIQLLIEGLEQDESLLDRLLIQAQGRPVFHKINSVHHFLNNQVIAGESWLDKMDTMISFALENGVCAIALRKDLAQPKQVAMIRKAGIYILAYTIDDDVELAVKLLDLGVSTICTDGVHLCDIPERFL